jgi:hypothetical protein
VSAGSTPGSEEEAELVAVRDETRFELGLLHTRVNALLATEAFLVIAYTAAMSDGAPWGRAFATVAGPLLAVLGLLLAVLAIPGVASTARIVLAQTALHERLATRLSGSAHRGYHAATGRSAVRDQRRSLLFFRLVSWLTAGFWLVLLVLAGVVLWR